MRNHHDTIKEGLPASERETPLDGNIQSDAAHLPQDGCPTVPLEAPPVPPGDLGVPTLSAQATMPDLRGIERFSAEIEAARSVFRAREANRKHALDVLGRVNALPFDPDYAAHPGLRRPAAFAAPAPTPHPRLRPPSSSVDTFLLGFVSGLLVAVLGLLLASCSAPSGDGGGAAPHTLVPVGPLVRDPTTGLMTDYRAILVQLHEPTPTPAAQAAVARAAGGAVVGELPELRILEVALPAGTSAAASADAVRRISGLPSVAVALPDVGLYPDDIPPEDADGSTRVGAQWNWSDTSTTAGNWGLRSIRAPTAWNLLDWARHVPTVVPLAMFDAGYFDHDDLAGILEVADPIGNALSPVRSHGTATSGIIGASWEDQRYVEGIAPSTRLTGVLIQRFATTLATVYFWGYGIDVKGAVAAAGAPRVVNMSVGWNLWRSRDPVTGLRCDPRDVQVADGTGCDPKVAQTRLASYGGMFGYAVRRLNERRPVLFVASAGNDSAAPPVGFGDFPAEYGSPAGWAAVNDPVVKDDVIVAEASKLEGADDGTGYAPNEARAPYSNVDGGGVFAPGHRVGVLAGTSSTTIASGTSFAAPMVTGAAAFLLTLSPRLTNADLRTLLTSLPYARPIAALGTTTATELDLTGAVYGLDDVHPKGRVTTTRKLLLDMDDGTIDGFTRTERDDTGMAVGPYTADAHGDGRVDLRDFRRLRDAYWAIQTNTWLGDARSPKWDLNEDGRVDAPKDEAYPRVAVAESRTLVAAPSRYLDRLETTFSLLAEEYVVSASQPWERGDLPGLLASADLLIFPKEALDTLGADSVLFDIGGSARPGLVADPAPTTEAALQKLRANGRAVFTTPLLDGATVTWRPVCAGKPQDPPVTVSVGTLDPGHDYVVTLGASSHLPCNRRAAGVIAVDPPKAVLTAGATEQFTATVDVAPWLGKRVRLEWNRGGDGALETTPAMNVLVTSTVTVLSATATYHAPSEAALEGAGLWLGTTGEIVAQLVDADTIGTRPLGESVADIRVCTPRNDSPDCTGVPCAAAPPYNTGEATYTARTPNESFTFHMVPCPDASCDPRKRSWSTEGTSVGTNGTSKGTEDCHMISDSDAVCRWTETTPAGVTTSGTSTVSVSGSPGPDVVLIGGWTVCDGTMLTLETVHVTATSSTTETCTNCGKRGVACFDRQWSGGFCEAYNRPHEACAGGLDNPCYPSACQVSCD